MDRRTFDGDLIVFLIVPVYYWFVITVWGIIRNRKQIILWFWVNYFLNFFLEGLFLGYSILTLNEKTWGGPRGDKVKDEDEAGEKNENNGRLKKDTDAEVPVRDLSGRRSPDMAPLSLGKSGAKAQASPLVHRSPGFSAVMQNSVREKTLLGSPQRVISLSPVVKSVKL